MTTTSPAAQAPLTVDRWQQFWNAWKAEPQQLEGIEQLRLAVIAADPAILTEAEHRRELIRDEAIKLWGQKRQEGWRACPPQWIPQKPLRA